MTITGRPCLPEELGQVRSWIAENPDWSRYRLSRELCARWQWVRPNGQLAGMAARHFLLKLHERELIALPPRQCASPNRMRHRRLECVALDRRPVVGELGSLGSLHSVPIRSGARCSRRCWPGSTIWATAARWAIMRRCGLCSAVVRIRTFLLLRRE